MKVGKNKPVQRTVRGRQAARQTCRQILLTCDICGAKIRAARSCIQQGGIKHHCGGVFRVAITGGNHYGT